MSGHRYAIRNSRDQQDPLIIDRQPPPELQNLFSRRREGASASTGGNNGRGRQGREEQPPPPSPPAPATPTSTTRAGRSSAPPPPPVIRPKSHSRTRPSTSSTQKSNTMPFSSTQLPKPGQPGYVPLPPKITTQEEQVIFEEREPRVSWDDGIDIIEGSGPSRRRSPRPYHRTLSSDPFREETVLESSTRPTQETENFEYIQPNESVRSRPRTDEIRSSKIYLDLKERNNKNYQAAKEANERHSKAEIRLQNLKQQFADLEIKSRQSEEELRRELDKTRQELDQTNNELAKTSQQLIECRRQRELDTRERDINARQVKLLQEKLDGGKQRNDEAAVERPREDSGSGSGSGGRRRRSHHPRPLTIHDNRPSSSSRDPEPRTSSSAYDPTVDFIAQAQADNAKRRSGRP